MKILLVDDSVTMRRIISKHLNNAGFDDLVEASNGVEALKHVNEVDLILF